MPAESLPRQRRRGETGEMRAGTNWTGTATPSLTFTLRFFLVVGHIGFRFDTGLQAIPLDALQIRGPTMVTCPVRLSSISFLRWQTSK